MNPRFKALTDQIRAIIGQDIKRQENNQKDEHVSSSNPNDFIKKPDNIKMEDGKSIMEQYLAKQEPNQEENENAYSKLV